ncbi:MAG: hypothetical protein EOP52_03400 [Sphingobacteriales bacterium]|nr:MAG: hypothetical protein EOP52_03400 [Sphingobacteriales bacterium]
MAFELLFPESASLPAPDDPALLDRIAARLHQLLQQSPEKLYQLLYRLDIPEHQVAEALSGAYPSAALAQCVLTRERQKIQYRRHASGTPPNWIEKDLSW